VIIPLFLGDISADVLEALGGVAERHGEGWLRATQAQDFVLRGVAADRMRGLYSQLDALGLARAEAPLLQNLVACIGPEICTPGCCPAPDLARALRQRLLANNRDWNALGDFRAFLAQDGRAVIDRLIALQ